MRSLLPGGFVPGSATSHVATTNFSSLPIRHPRSDEVFVNAPALSAVVDADDGVNAQTRTAWSDLIRSSTPLVTSNCVRVETGTVFRRFEMGDF